MCPIDFTTTEGAIISLDKYTLLPETKVQICIQAGNITLRKGKTRQNGEDVVPDSEEDRKSLVPFPSLFFDVNI